MGEFTYHKFKYVKQDYQERRKFKKSLLAFQWKAEEVFDLLKQAS